MRQSDVWECPRCRTAYLASAKEPRFPRRAWGVVCSACRSDSNHLASQWFFFAAVAVFVTVVAIAKGAA
jgi:hypothetical protein